MLLRRGRGSTRFEGTESCCSFYHFNNASCSGRGSTRFEGTESTMQHIFVLTIPPGGRGSTRFEGTERCEPGSRPSLYRLGGRGSTRFEGTESGQDGGGQCRLTQVAEVRPALRVLKAGLSATYNNNIERWQRFDPL